MAFSIDIAQIHRSISRQASELGFTRKEECLVISEKYTSG
jgi:hypothetical protein